MNKPYRTAYLTLICVVIVFALPYLPCFTLAGGEAQQGPMKTMERIYMIGHRGAAGLAPENTLSSFMRAIEIEVDCIELDVLMTADGELVVHHGFRLNPNIARTANGKWLPNALTPAIKTLPLVELKTYDVGRINPDTPFANRHPQQQPLDGERIPTLGEVIDLLKKKAGKKIKLCIEIKTSPQKPELTPTPEIISDAVVDLLDKERILDRAFIFSFDWRSLLHIQKIAPDLQIVFLSSTSMRHNTIRIGMPGPSEWTAGLDVDDYDGSIPRLVKAAGGRYWGPKYNQVMSFEIEEAHRIGINVFVWTVDRKRDMLKLIDKGVDGIITNRPDILKSILNEP